jgi:hypothetical protein
MADVRTLTDRDLETVRDELWRLHSTLAGDGRDRAADLVLELLGPVHDELAGRGAPIPDRLRPTK